MFVEKKRSTLKVFLKFPVSPQPVSSPFYLGCHCLPKTLSPIVQGAWSSHLCVPDWHKTAPGKHWPNEWETIRVNFPWQIRDRGPHVSLGGILAGSEVGVL